jgi:ribosome-associated heat shock protein Hsp15
VDEVRVDRWLCAARVFKSRTQANEACGAGHVRVNDTYAKPHHPVRVGDQLRVQTEARPRILEVVGLSDKRLSPPLARELYVDHSPPPPPPPDRSGLPVRDRGAGRPTKRESRLLRGIRGR